jgi:HD superfamily phosphodiesterase
MIGTVLNMMILFFGSDSKRIQHAMKVYCFAFALWEQEAREKLISDTDERKTVLLLAAILHDIGIQEAERKYGSSAGKFQETEGPPIAAQILSACDVEEKIIARVCYLIGHHHSYSMIDGLDFQILVEADLLVNLEEDKSGKQEIFSVRENFMKTAGAKELLESYLTSGK